jgi:hypothetical protein
MNLPYHEIGTKRLENPFWVEVSVGGDEGT